MLRMVTSGMMRKNSKYLSYLDIDNINGTRKGAVFFECRGEFFLWNIFTIKSQ